MWTLVQGDNYKETVLLMDILIPAGGLHSFLIIDDLQNAGVFPDRSSCIPGGRLSIPRLGFLRPLGGMWGEKREYSFEYTPLFDVCYYF